MRARRHRTRTAAGVAASLLVAAVALRCVRRDELFCENAVAHLERCCTGFHPDQAYCTYTEGCGAAYPTITEDDSTCLVGMSCGEIVSAGICQRALDAIAPTATQPGTDLCP